MQDNYVNHSFSKRKLHRRFLTFGKKMLIAFCEYPISLWYYKSFRIPLVNHLTIGIKVLARKRTIFPHPIGLVIGRNVVIGEGCTIYQNVTIGVKDIKKLEYPSIGNNVIIYASAIIIGNVKIGDNSIIGAGCIVTKDVPENKVALGSPMRIIDKKMSSID